MLTKYCYILNYANSTISRLDLYKDKSSQDFIDIDGTILEEDLLRHWGVRPIDCNWMFSNVELDTINIITNPKKH